MRSITFTVPGVAVPWARAGRKGGFSFTPAKQRSAMTEIKVLAQRAMNGSPLFEGPVSVKVTATYQWPKSVTKQRRMSDTGHWKATRPDISNIVKLIEDALNGVVYTDDGQIAVSIAYKFFAEKTGLAVSIREIGSA